MLAELAGRIPAEGEKPPTIVLAIDQAEELFRPEGAAEGAALLELIRDLAREDAPALIAIFAIRSESYDALLHAKALEGLAQATLPLLPMPRGAYKDVIEGPARRFTEAGGALTIEPQLTLRLLEDIEQGAGSDALPLLAFTLEQLFLDWRREGALRLKDYQDFGGLKGAIDAAVARAFVRADSDPRIPKDRKAREALLRRGLIPWLAGIDPDSKSPRRNIARRSEIPAEAAPLIDLLVEERLVSTDAHAETDASGAETRVVTIEPAHEALLRQWGLLEGWLAEDFALLTTLEGVKRATRDWEANGRADAWLAHGGQRLAEAQALDARADIAAKLDPADRAYLAACRAREEAARAEVETRRREREEAQARRLADARRLAAARGRVAWAAGAGLVVALALAGVAVWQWRDATAQRIEAQQAEQDAKRQSDWATNALTLATETADGLVFDLALKFRDVAGVPASLVKEILEHALALQDQLLAAGESSPELRRSQASALGETSRTLLALGDTNGALADASRAVQILESMAREHLDDDDLQRDLSASYQKVGAVRVAQGDLAAALKSFQNEFAILNRLAKADPGDAGLQDDLAAAKGNLGDVQRDQGDLAAALKSYQDGLVLIDGLAKADPGNSGWQRDLFASYNHVGDVLVAQRDLPAALKLYQNSLAIADRFAKADPGNSRWQRDLFASYTHIGDVLVAQRELPTALKSYQDSLAISDRLAKAHPDNAGWQRDLLASYNHVGNVRAAQGDLPAARKSYQDSLAIADRLAKANPGNAGSQHDLAQAYAGVAYVHLIANRPAEARAALDAGRAILAKLVADHPDFAQWKKNLAWFDAQIAALGK
jgi:tetratricopeptide (TPR) repeat protein